MVLGGDGFGFVSCDEGICNVNMAMCRLGQDECWRKLHM